MKKIFLVEVEEVDYDQYDSCVVVADNAEQAIEIGKDLFEEDQGEITAKEIDLTTEGVVLTSFNAG